MIHYFVRIKLWQRQCWEILTIVARHGFAEVEGPFSSPQMKGIGGMKGQDVINNSGKNHDGKG